MKESEQPAPPIQERRPTEWHALTFQEMAFAKTHADFLLRTVFHSPDKDVLPAAREAIEQETRNLLYVHRGASIAAWMMEHARKTGKLPGHDGKLEDLKPAKHEEMQLSMDRPGHEAPGPKPPSETLADQARELCALIEALPAGEEQTAASLAASSLREKLFFLNV